MTVKQNLISFPKSCTQKDFYLTHQILKDVQLQLETEISVPWDSLGRAPASTLTCRLHTRRSRSPCGTSHSSVFRPWRTDNRRWISEPPPPPQWSPAVWSWWPPRGSLTDTSGIQWKSWKTPGNQRRVYGLIKADEKEALKFTVLFSRHESTY